MRAHFIDISASIFSFRCIKQLSFAPMVQKKLRMRYLVIPQGAPSKSSRGLLRVASVKPLRTVLSSSTPSLQFWPCKVCTLPEWIRLQSQLRGNCSISHLLRVTCSSENCKTCCYHATRIYMIYNTAMT